LIRSKRLTIEILSWVSAEALTTRQSCFSPERIRMIAGISSGYAIGTKLTLKSQEGIAPPRCGIACDVLIPNYQDLLAKSRDGMLNRLNSFNDDRSRSAPLQRSFNQTMSVRMIWPPT
jgi:hypothetical protein